MTAPVPAFLADPRDPWMRLTTADRNTILRGLAAAAYWLSQGDDGSDEEEAAAYETLLKRLGEA